MDPTTLQTTWYALLGVVWVLYLVLGGTDLGVGMLVRRTDRSSALRAIGPTWAANDVWLVLAIAATLGAFPGWYAELLSGAYLPLVVLVGALMVRHAAIELLGHATPKAGARWERALVATSLVIPFLWGLIWAGALDGSLARGRDAGLGLLQPEGVLAGLALVALCRAQGVAFLRLRIPSARADLSLLPGAALAAALLLLAAAALTAGAAAGVQVGPLGALLALVAGAGLGMLVLGAVVVRDDWALLGAATTTAGAVGVVLAVLHHAPVAGRGPHAVRLAEAAAGDVTLTAMLVIAGVLLPPLLVALGYAYVRFLRAPGDAPTAGPGSLLARAVRGTLRELR